MVCFFDSTVEKLWRMAQDKSKRGNKKQIKNKKQKKNEKTGKEVTIHSRFDDTINRAVL